MPADPIALEHTAVTLGRHASATLKDVGRGAKLSDFRKSAAIAAAIELMASGAPRAYAAATGSNSSRA